MSSPSIYHLPCCCINCKLQLSVQNLGRHYESLHKTNLHSCLHCGTTIPIKKKFCNSSCSAKYNNSLRKLRGWTASEKQRNMARQVAKQNFYKQFPQKVCIVCGNHNITRRKTCSDACYSTYHTRKCKKCGLIETTTGNFQSEYCVFCNPSTAYRLLCKFTFNLKSFPNEFDLQLLDIHGMFHPKHNRHGVSRDHIISINYGKIHRIDPKIISHPANCQLLLQSENSKKHVSNGISFNKLLEKIEHWSKKYPN